MTAPRPVAWHVGRQGEVAGGMTQVVNGYVGWPFERFDVRVIRSRDGSSGPRAWRLFLGALWQVATLKGTDRHVFVVHLSQGGSFVREGWLLRLARWRGFGTVAHLHGSRFVDYAAGQPRRVGTVLRAATKVIVLSDATFDAVCRFVPKERVVRIPNAVPGGNPVAKEPLIVFGGSVSRRKGVDVLMRAWKSLQPVGAWQLQVAGPVADADVVDKALPGVVFSGALEHRALMSLLDRASIAVLPSRDEAMPMFILEAMARDNCVVSTRVGGIPAVLGNGQGVLVDPGDADQLAQALRRAMDNAAWRQETAAAGRAAFDAGFSAQAVYPKVEQLWHTVLQHPDPVPGTASVTAERRA